MAASKLIFKLSGPRVVAAGALTLAGNALLCLIRLAGEVVSVSGVLT